MASKDKTASRREAEPAGIGGKVAQAREFFEESQAEIKKVVWPTRQEATATSIAVFAVVIVMTLFLGLADSLLSLFIKAVMS
jgi:preprotein translocase subunit SecE